MLMPYATSLAAATVIFIELFDPSHGLINWLLPARAPPSGRRLAGIEVAEPDRRLDDRHLAVDRLQRADLPRRHAGDRRLALRGGGHGRRVALEAVPLRHASGAATDIVFTIVVSTIGATQLFGEPLLYDPTGQPNGGSSNQYQTLGLLMYQQGWTYDRLGLASATAWTMFVIIVLAVVVNLILARRRARS